VASHIQESTPSRITIRYLINFSIRLGVSKYLWTSAIYR